MVATPPTSNLARCAPRVLALLGALTLGCSEFDISGLDALIDDEESYVELPGRKLATGTYRAIGTDGNFRESGFALGVDGERNLIIAPYSGGGPCTATPAQTYDRFWFRVGPNVSPGFVNHLEAIDERGFGTLHFTDFQCRPWIEPLVGAKLLPLSYSAAFPWLLAAGREGELWAIGLQPRGVTEVAQGVARAEILLGQLWTLEAGQLVQRNAQLARTLGVGANVTTFVANGARVYFLDDLGLQAADPGSDGAELLLSDVCALATAGRFVAYLPCTEPRVTLLDDDASLPTIVEGDADARTDERFVLPAGASFPPRVFTAQVGGKPTELVAYTLPDESLWVGPLEGESTRIGERGLLDSIIVGSSTLRALVDWDGATGRLVQWEVARPVLELARGVPRIGPDLDATVVTDLVDGAGDRVRFDRQGRRTLLATRSPPDSYAGVDSEAFLSDFDGTTGTLQFYSSALGVVPITRDVLPRFYDIAPFAAPAITYLRNRDAARGAGVLGVYFPETCGQFEVTDVSEWEVTTWPDSGILYSVRTGPRAGIWFAPAQ